MTELQLRSVTAPGLCVIACRVRQDAAAQAQSLAPGSLHLLIDGDRVEARYDGRSGALVCAPEIGLLAVSGMGYGCGIALLAVGATLAALSGVRVSYHNVTTAGASVMIAFAVGYLAQRVQRMLERRRQRRYGPRSWSFAAGSVSHFEVTPRGVRVFWKLRSDTNPQPQAPCAALLDVQPPHTVDDLVTVLERLQVPRTDTS